jgi:hypothetical protein
MHGAIRGIRGTAAPAAKARARRVSGLDPVTEVTGSRIRMA